MSSPKRPVELFPALLKHWRGRRGMSQLDLALAADVSSRHVSFLETGRSAPSAEMVVRLGAALDVPLRHVNAMLQSAGHPATFHEDDEGALPDVIQTALDTMKAHHDPYPLVVIDRAYDVVDANRGGQALFAAILADIGEAPAAPLNLLRLTFRRETQRRIVNFDEVGRTLLWRVQREVLASPDPHPLRDILEAVLRSPTVADDWREVDFAELASPVVIVHLRLGNQELRFLTTVTAFQAPQSVFLDELRIEAWYPTDDETAAACRSLVAQD